MDSNKKLFFSFSAAYAFILIVFIFFRVLMNRIQPSDNDELYYANAFIICGVFFIGLLSLGSSIVYLIFLIFQKVPRTWFVGAFAVTILAVLYFLNLFFFGIR